MLFGVKVEMALLIQNKNIVWPEVVFGGKNNFMQTTFLFF